MDTSSLINLLQIVLWVMVVLAIVIIIFLVGSEESNNIRQELSAKYDSVPKRLKYLRDQFARGVMRIVISIVALTMLSLTVQGIAWAWPFISDWFTTIGKPDTIYMVGKITIVILKVLTVPLVLWALVALIALAVTIYEKTVGTASR